MSRTLYGFNKLRSLIRSLEPTGIDGFEGLIGAVLSDITKLAFALAKSGPQHGRDGQSAFDAGSIRFEAKLYKEQVGKGELLGKLAETYSDDDGDTDLWVLASTGTVSVQDRQGIADFTGKTAFASLIVDWASPGIPQLATLLTMAPDATARFVANHTSAMEGSVHKLLSNVQADPGFQSMAEELRSALAAPSLGPISALQSNNDHIYRALRDSDTAQRQFGQRLSPGDPTLAGILDRTALVDRISQLAFSPPKRSNVFILGAEGTGKSWLIAQALLRQTPKSLIIFATPADIKFGPSASEAEDFLISTFISQTHDLHTPEVLKRWRRHLGLWRKSPSLKEPRVIVVLDGLNQNATIEWARLIDVLGDVILKLGGKLILTCRSQFFASRLRDRLVDPAAPVNVEEWTLPELEMTLAAHGVPIGIVPASVLPMLRNPRVCAVAVAMYKKREIASFAELSVTQLLFAHLNANASQETISPAAFAQELQAHAKTLFDRLEANAGGDLWVFNRSVPGREPTSIAERLLEVANGSFFEPIIGDPGRYRLKGDSTYLALGLSILSCAQRAHVDGQDIRAALTKLLDPIQAFDDAAELLLSGLIVSVLSPEVADAVTAGIARAYVELQNVDRSRYEEFRSLVRRAPLAFLRAMEEATLDDSSSQNLSWLTDALLQNRDELSSRGPIRQACKRWLSMYSLDPLRRTASRGAVGSPEEVRERAKQEELLNARLSALSDGEKEFLKRGCHLIPRGDYSDLSRLAFWLLAGTPLAECAEALRNWCYAAALNGGYRNYSEEFDHLVQLNRVDWAQTRQALLTALDVFKAPDISEVGRWALVGGLWATGASQDARAAQAIWMELTGDRPHINGWRRVENFCATDPCDPSSDEPQNLVATAVRFSQMDVAKLGRSKGQSIEDLNFRDSLLGVARFRPDSALATLRRFAINVSTRPLKELEVAIWRVYDHSSALDPTSAHRYLGPANVLAQHAISEGDPHSQLLLASQFALILAFPYLSGNEQLELLLAYPQSAEILVSLSNLMIKCDPEAFDSEIAKAHADNDSGRLHRLLWFANSTLMPLSKAARAVVEALALGTDSKLRTAAFALIWRLKDLELARLVAQGDWDAHHHRTSDGTEAAFGSTVLAMAASDGAISVEDCLRRISLAGYGLLARYANAEGLAGIAKHLDLQLNAALKAQVPDNLPIIESSGDKEVPPGRYRIEDRRKPQVTARDTFEALAESEELWLKRQAESRSAALAFREGLATSGADLVIDPVPTELLYRIHHSDPGKLREWLARVMSLDSESLKKVHHFALSVAQVAADFDPPGAVPAFQRLSLLTPHVTVAEGEVQLNLQFLAVWRAKDGDELNALRFKRLDTARDDHTLAMEVLAASLSGKSSILREYVLDRRKRAEPSHVARALMVAALSQDEPWVEETISDRKDEAGFLKEAYEGATYAISRLRWSNHWAGLMAQAQTPADFWRAGVLLTKIVDGRFAGIITGAPPSEVASRFISTFDDDIRNRIGKWKNKREKTLFGRKMPNPIFIDNDIVS